MLRQRTAELQLGALCGQLQNALLCIGAASEKLPQPAAGLPGLLPSAAAAVAAAGSAPRVLWLTPGLRGSSTPRAASISGIRAASQLSFSSLRSLACALHYQRSFAARAGALDAASRADGVAAPPPPPVAASSNRGGSRHSSRSPSSPGSSSIRHSSISSRRSSRSRPSGSLSTVMSSRRGGFQLQGEEPRSSDALHLPAVSPQDAALLEAVQGNEERLMQLLRDQRRIQLFNAALLAVPETQVVDVLSALLQCAAGSSGSGSSGSSGSSSSQGEPVVAAFLDGVVAAASSSGSSMSQSQSSSVSSTGGVAVGSGSCRPSHRTVRALLHRLSGCTSEELRLSVDSWMRRLLDAGLPPTYQSFLPWATLHSKRGSVQGVRLVMQQVEAHSGGPANVAPHYYVQLIRAYSTSGRWREADTLLQEMRQQGVAPTEHIYRALIYNYGRYHRGDLSGAVFEDMRASGVTPSLATWSALLNAYADSRQPAQAVEALQEMRKEGVTPSLEVWGALTKAFARSGDWRRAVDVVEMMLAEGAAPNEQIWGCVVEAAAVAGKPSVAEAVILRMRAAGVPPNVIAYTSLLSSYGASRDVEAAERVLLQMAAQGCKPNKKTYTELMSQLAARGMYEECQRYFEQMLAEGWPADKVSYAILIDSMLHRWAADRAGQQPVLALVQARWEEAVGAGALAPHTYVHQPQGRMVLDLHGYSGWTGQLAVLATLSSLAAQHAQHAGDGGGPVSRLDVITGRGNRSAQRHRPVLRELVLEMLQHLLPVEFSHSNDGILVLHARDLRKLLESTRVAGKSFSLAAMQHCLVEPP